jgi:hypothetical protein
MGVRFVIVGTGRSGTKYASELFSQLGIPCGHESFFDPGHAAQDNLAGDASFGVVPFLNKFGGVVFHQVRHPLSVLSSIAATKFFESPVPYLPYLELIEDCLPEIRQFADPILKAVYYVVRWNRMCEAIAQLRWRVEDLDAKTLRRAAEIVGFTRTHAECASALDAVPQDVNRLELRGLRRLRFGWQDIPTSAQKSDLAQMAIDYGYEVSDDYCSWREEQAGPGQSSASV